MTGFPRYAIYFAAGSDAALSRFGAELLGYDAYTGNELPFPHDALHVAPDWRDISADPRKYGFHATLKAPMALADGKTENELRTACADFANAVRAIPVETKLRDAVRAGQLDRAPGYMLDEMGLQAGVITQAEYQTLQDAEAARNEVIAVDAFDAETFKTLH